MRDLKRKEKLVEAAGEAYGRTLTLATLDVCTDQSVTYCINSLNGRHLDVLSKSHIHTIHTPYTHHTHSTHTHTRQHTNTSHTPASYHIRSSRYTYRTAHSKTQITTHC